MLDQYYYCTTERISPESPSPITKLDKIKSNAGGASNVAMNIASLSGKVALCSFIGKDKSSVILNNILSSQNIKTVFIKTKLPTITKIRIISQEQQILRLDFEKSFKNLDKTELLSGISNIVKDYNVLILSDYGKGTLSNTEEIIKFSKLNNMKIIVDPKGNNFAKYQGAYIITPNRKEFENVVGKCNSNKEIKEKALKLIHYYKLNGLLVTNSEKGMILILKNKTFINMPAFTKNAINVTGAGDTVIAVIAMALSSGYNLITAVHFANIAASIVVKKKETSTLNYKEFYGAIENKEIITKQEININQEKIIRIIKRLYLNNKKIIIVHGTFAIINYHNINFLKQANALGDYLIVAINIYQAHYSNSIKNHLTEISIQDRLAILSEISCVYQTVLFENFIGELIYKILLNVYTAKNNRYKIKKIDKNDIILISKKETKIFTYNNKQNK